MKTTQPFIILTILLTTLLTGPIFAEDPKPSIAQQAYDLRMDGHNQDARDLLETHLAGHPDDALARFEYSRLLFYLFEFEPAQTAAQKVVQAEPANPRYQFWLGETCVYNAINQYKLGKPERFGDHVRAAIAAFEKTLELQPDHHEARFDLINMYNNNASKDGGNKSLAKKHLKILEARDPYYGVWARTIVDRPSPEKAIRLIEPLLKKYPDNAGLHLLMAVKCVEANQIDNARQHTDQAIKLDFSKNPIRLTIAFKLAQDKDYDAARTQIETFLKTQPDRPAAIKAFALHYLATLEHKAGNNDLAQQVAQRVKATDPNVWTTMKLPPEEVFRPLTTK